MEEEIWKNITDFPGYMVSNMGRIKSIGKICACRGGTRIKKDTILKGTIDGRGYIKIDLYKDGKTYNRRIHRLVGEHFIPNPENLPEINHKTGIKTDNRASELEWTTRVGNALHSFEIGLQDNKGENHSQHKLTNSDVLAIREKYSQSKSTRTELASEYGMSKSMITLIVNRKNWKHI